MEKISLHYTQDGLLKTSIWAACRVMERIVWLRRSYIITKNLDREPLYIKARVAVEYKNASRNDFVTFGQHLLPWKYHRDVFDDRIGRDVTCIIGFVGSQAVGFIWMTSRPERDRRLGFTITPNDDELYGLDLYVLPQYRKDLVGYELISIWLNNAYKKGKRRVMGVVEEWNKPMLMTTRLVFGFKIAETLYSVEFFKKKGILIHTAVKSATIR